MPRKTLQEEFDKKYIAANEIIEMMSVTRVAVLYARKRGILPEPIIVPGSKTHLWIRDDVKKNLEAWKMSLQARRGELVQ